MTTKTLADNLKEQYETGGEMPAEQPDFLLKPTNLNPDEFFESLSKEQMIKYIQFLRLQREEQRKTFKSLYFYAKGLEGTN